MRLARLAAVGLAVGLIAGFAIALLRTRPAAVADLAPLVASPDPRPTGSAPVVDGALATVDRSDAKRDGGSDNSEDSTVLDARRHRRVPG